MGAIQPPHVESRGWVNFLGSLKYIRCNEYILVSARLPSAFPFQMAVLTWVCITVRNSKADGKRHGCNCKMNSSRCKKKKTVQPQLLPRWVRMTFSVPAARNDNVKRVRDVRMRAYQYDTNLYMPYVRQTMRDMSCLAVARHCIIRLNFVDWQMSEPSTGNQHQHEDQGQSKTVFHTRKGPLSESGWSEKKSDGVGTLPRVLQHLLMLGWL
jgi:hypothetical protein